MSTHMWGFSSHRPCLLCSRRPAWYSAVLAGLQMKNTPTHFFCATSQKAAHSHWSGFPVDEEWCYHRAPNKHYPFFLCSREGVLKIQKEAAGRLYLCSIWHTTKTSTHLLACKTSQQTCVHYITKLTLSLHQFLELISISSQQTQLKDSDTIFPWKETGDQLWLVEIIWVGKAVYSPWGG